MNLHRLIIRLTLIWNLCILCINLIFYFDFWASGIRSLLNLIWVYRRILFTKILFFIVKIEFFLIIRFTATTAWIHHFLILTLPFNLLFKINRRILHQITILRVLHFLIIDLNIIPILYSHSLFCIFWCAQNQNAIFI